MPKGQIPAQYHDIMQSTALGHLATLDAEGLPQVNPVWFLWDGEHVLMSVKANTQKYRNLLAQPPPRHLIPGSDATAALCRDSRRGDRL